jgi:hypothetical protein
LTAPHLPHEMDLEMWSAVDRGGCFLLRYPNLWRFITFYDLAQPGFNSTKWSSIAKLVNITPTRTYGRYIYSWWGYKPTNISGWHHIVGMSQLMQVHNHDSMIILWLVDDVLRKTLLNVLMYMYIYIFIERIARIYNGIFRKTLWYDVYIILIKITSWSFEILAGLMGYNQP